MSKTKRVLSKGKTPSSSRWLLRQRKDPLVVQSKLDQYRARSAYKLIEIDDKYKFLKKNSFVLDLGARPGAWSQVASRRIGTDQFTLNELSSWNYGIVLAVDKEEMKGLPGVFVIDNADITSVETVQCIKSFLSGHKVDVIMSDMAPNSCGVQNLDHQRIMDLAVSAWNLSQKCLKINGTFLCKLWDGSLLPGFKNDLKQTFQSVHEVRCQATRKESAEVYLVAHNYKDNY